MADQSLNAPHIGRRAPFAAARGAAARDEATQTTDPLAWRRLAVRVGVFLALCGGLFLWWRWGLPVGMADAIWLCFS